jgi:hypothetical protein
VSRLGIELPRAIEVDVALESPDDSPNIVLHGTQILVDAEPAGDVSEIVAAPRLKRLDGLFSSLKARREARERQWPGDPGVGVATLWCDQRTSLFVFKSLFQTAAFAAYPRLRLAVLRADTQQLAYQSFDARVPHPPRAGDPPPSTPFALHVEYSAEGRAQLIWKVGSRVEDTIDVTRETLARQIAEQWRTRGGHRGRNDLGFDQLVLHAASSLTLNDAVRLLDAARFPKRDYLDGGRVLRLPAFDVTFSIN